MQKIDGFKFIRVKIDENARSLELCWILRILFRICLVNLPVPVFEKVRQSRKLFTLPLYPRDSEHSRIANSSLPACFEMPFDSRRGAALDS